MAGANKEQPAGTRRNRMSFCEDGPAARRASGPTCTDTEGTRLHSHHRSAAAANPGTQTTLSICHLTPAWQREGCREAAGAECDLLFLCPPERVAVWDAVAAYVQEHLLVQKVGWLPGSSSPCPPQPRLPPTLPLHRKQEITPRVSTGHAMGFLQIPQDHLCWALSCLRADPARGKPLDPIRLLLP